MKKLVDILLSAIYLLYFGLCICVFHLVQVISFNLFGPKAHQKSVNVLNWFLVHGWLLTGSTSKVIFKTSLPLQTPIIFVANHRSMFDIPGMIWYLRKYTPLFVSKIELAKGIPSISYNLRKGGAALIDRKDGKRAVVEIAKLGKRIKERKVSAAIFPEGTRARVGKMKTFQVGGVATLLKRCPEALIVPVAINNTGSFNPKGLFPLRSFTRMTWTVLPPVKTANQSPEEIVKTCETAISKELGITT